MIQRRLDPSGDVVASEQVGEDVDDEKEEDDPGEDIEHGQEEIAECPVRSEYVHDALPPSRKSAAGSIAGNRRPRGPRSCWRLRWVRDFVLRQLRGSANGRDGLDCRRECLRSRGATARRPHAGRRVPALLMFLVPAAAFALWSSSGVAHACDPVTGEGCDTVPPSSAPTASTAESPARRQRHPRQRRLRPRHLRPRRLRQRRPADRWFRRRRQRLRPRPPPLPPRLRRPWRRRRRHRTSRRPNPTPAGEGCRGSWRPLSLPCSWRAPWAREPCSSPRRSPIHSRRTPTRATTCAG